MYFDCVSCPQLGISCDGPNFVAMSAHDLLEWCKMRKAKLGLSNAKLAELSGAPKGTIDRLLSTDHPDFKYETIRPIIKALVGGSFSGKPCPCPQGTPSPDAELVLRVHDLEKDLGFADKTINRLETSEKSWRRAIYAMMMLCGVMAASLVGYINMDMNNTDIGLFREDYISPAVLLPILGILAACGVAVWLIWHKIKKRKQK